MEKNLYIDASHPNETRIVLKSNSSIEEYEVEDKNNLNFKNNIYLATISRVEPSLQAAFVNFGRERHGFLAFNDIQSDYYQLPSEDKEKIRIAEEKIREELKDKIIESNQDTSQSDNQLDNLDNKDEKNDNTENQLEKGNNKQEYREKVKSSFGIKRYKIQEVIKPGQVILIQVIKEERGQKGAALTTFISLAGKYMVLMPNTAKGGGISRKIFNSSDRQKIRNILNEIDIPKSMGVIVRTAGANKTKNEIEKDFHNTMKTWDEIKEKALDSNAPSLVYEEGDIIKRTLRDTYDNETKNVYVEGNEAYQKAKKFMKELMPKNVKNIKKYIDDDVMKSEIYCALDATGTVCGEYGFRDAYKGKMHFVEEMMKVDDEAVKAFANEYKAQLDRLIEEEHNRATKDLEVRKKVWGVSEDKKGNERDG